MIVSRLALPLPGVGVATTVSRVCDHFDHFEQTHSAPQSADGPAVWTRRRLAPPGGDLFDQPLVIKVRGRGLVVVTGCGHCTGWRAQHALARALPKAWVQPSVGSRYQLSAA